MSNDKYSNTQKICNILKLLHQGRTLEPSSTALRKELEIEEKTLRRYLSDIAGCFDGIQTEKIERDGKKVISYRLVDDKQALADMLRLFVRQDSSDFLEMVRLVYENDSTIFEMFESDYKAILENRLKKESDIIKFYSNPLEDLQNKNNRIFEELKKCVKERLYKTITLERTETQIYKDAKCLKLLFSKGNWYLAIETDDDNLRLIRISFITKLDHPSSSKFSFQKSVLDKYKDYFDSFQNPFSINAKKQKAVLLAKPEVAVYFKEGMKPFFKSQQYISTEQNGSIKFSVDFTQPMEIKPFIKEWSPYISVLEPLELKQDIASDLKQLLKDLSVD